MPEIVIRLWDDDTEGVQCRVNFDEQVSLTGEEGDLSPSQFLALQMLMHAFPPSEDGVEWAPRTEDVPDPDDDNKKRSH